MNLIFLIVQLVFLMSILAIRGLDSFTASNRSAANSKRVVNGYNAIGDRRFYVRLRLEEGVMGPDTVCGGTIVAQDLVVTAAHCLKRHHHVRILYGDWTKTGRKNIDDFPHFDDDRSLPVVPKSSQELFRAAYTLHPQWDGDQYDIALIKFNKPVFKKEHVMPLCLADKKYKKFKIAGMGCMMTPTMPPLPKQLQEHNFEELKHTGGSCLKPPCQPCGTRYDKAHNLCHQEGVSGKGDSGGPIFAVESDAQGAKGLCLYGSVSLHLHDTEFDRAERVAYYTDWIKEAMATRI